MIDAPTLRRRTGRVALVTFGLMLAGALPACSAKKDTRACPKVEVVGDLSRKVQFAEGAGREPADVLYVASIADVKSGCTYDKRGVTIDMVVSIIGERGRAAGKLKEAEIAYFVAIVDSQQSIVGKRIFTSKLDFSDDSPRIDDELDQIIPIAAQSLSADDHTVIVGLQLTSEQIDFNQKPQRN